MDCPPFVCVMLPVFVSSSWHWDSKNLPAKRNNCHFVLPLCAIPPSPLWLTLAVNIRPLRMQWFFNHRRAGGGAQRVTEQGILAVKIIRCLWKFVHRRASCRSGRVSFLLQQQFYNLHSCRWKGFPFFRARFEFLSTYRTMN